MLSLQAKHCTGFAQYSQFLLNQKGKLDPHLYELQYQKPSAVRTQLNTHCTAQSTPQLPAQAINVFPLTCLWEASLTLSIFPRRGNTPYLSLPTTPKPETASVLAESPSVRMSVQSIEFLLPEKQKTKTQVFKLRSEVEASIPQIAWDNIKSYRSGCIVHAAMQNEHKLSLSLEDNCFLCLVSKCYLFLNNLATKDAKYLPASLASSSLGTPLILVCFTAEHFLFSWVWALNFTQFRILSTMPQPTACNGQTKLQNKINHGKTFKL